MVLTLLSKEKSLGTIPVERGKVSQVKVYLKENATEILGLTEKVGEYSVNIKANKIIAPLSKNSIVGTAEIINNEGNIINEIDIIIKEDLRKASFFDYLKRNLKTITAGK